MERHCYQHVEIFLLVETELLSAVERSLWTTQLISGEGRREVFDECSLSVNTRHGDSFLTEQNASEVISSICRRATANKKWVNVLLFLLLDLAFFSPWKRCCALQKKAVGHFCGGPLSVKSLTHGRHCKYWLGAHVVFTGRGPSFSLPFTIFSFVQWKMWLSKQRTWR